MEEGVGTRVVQNEEVHLLLSEIQCQNLKTHILRAESDEER